MRRMIKTFTEEIVEAFDGSTWAQLEPEPGSIDLVINEWAVRESINIINVTLFEDDNMSMSGTERSRSVRYVIVYETNQSIQAAPALPLSNKAVAPTVDVTLIENGLSRTAKAMAGICGVIEGYFLHPDDAEPAPPPLLSPDIEWDKIQHLFGNIKNAS